MDRVKEVEKVLDDIYSGRLSEIDGKIIGILEGGMKQGVNDQSRFVAIMRECETAMKNKDYLYISDLLKFELLPIMT